MSTATGEAATTYRAALGDRVGSLLGVRGLERAKLALILFQLGLLAIVIRQFQIESGAFLRIALLAFAGFFVHYFLRCLVPASVLRCSSLVGDRPGNGRRQRGRAHLDRNASHRPLPSAGALRSATSGFSRSPE